MDDRLIEAGARIEATIHKINGHWWNRRKRPDARDLRILLEAVTDQSARLAGVKEGLEMAAKVSDGLVSLATDLRAGRGSSDTTTIGDAWRRVADGAQDISDAIRAIPVKADH